MLPNRTDTMEARVSHLAASVLKSLSHLCREELRGEDDTGVNEVSSFI